jgi:hypothetical protein
MAKPWRCRPDSTADSASAARTASGIANAAARRSALTYSTVGADLGGRRLAQRFPGFC